MSIGWIVAFSKVGREYYAAENLTRQSVDYYIPKIIEYAERGRRKERHTIAKATPLFPRYIFIHVNHQWRHVLSTFGVAGVIMQGDSPAFIGQKAIDQIREREDEEGLVHLPQPEQLSQGDKVKVITGPFSGAIGICEGMSVKDRQKVLLDYLGRKTSVLLGEEMLQRVA
jgi:transcriptional antiterminator RfaH